MNQGRGNTVIKANGKTIVPIMNNDGSVTVFVTGEENKDVNNYIGDTFSCDRKHKREEEMFKEEIVKRRQVKKEARKWMDKERREQLMKTVNVRRTHRIWKKHRIIQ